MQVSVPFMVALVGCLVAASFLCASVGKVLQFRSYFETCRRRRYHKRDGVFRGNNEPKSVSGAVKD